MAVEIERKFLADKKKLKLPDEGKKIIQGFLSTDFNRLVRIRVTGEVAYLTIKGKTIRMSRDEYEYEIPVQDAKELLRKHCKRPLIEKTRYVIDFKGHSWEIDIFEGENNGLVIAEIELITEDETFEKPDWLLREVTDDERYYNSNLAIKPYSSWS